VGETTVEQIPLPGIGLDYPGAQLDGEGGDIASLLSQGQGGADPERQAVQKRGEPTEINPSAVRLGMTARRVELAPERSGRQRRMIRGDRVRRTHGRRCREPAAVASAPW
jgi:hypothetical protein